MKMNGWRTVRQAEVEKQRFTVHVAHLLRIRCFLPLKTNTILVLVFIRITNNDQLNRCPALEKNNVFMLLLNRWFMLSLFYCKGTQELG